MSIAIVPVTFSSGRLCRGSCGGRDLKIAWIDWTISYLRINISLQKHIGGQGQGDRVRKSKIYLLVMNFISSIALDSVSSSVSQKMKDHEER